MRPEEDTDELLKPCPAPPEAATDEHQDDDVHGTVDLVAQAAAGDARAWEDLYERYKKALRAILRSRMREVPRSRFDTEDVLQSTFLSAYTALDGFTYQGPESFRKWLTSILMNKLFDKMRFNTREQRDTGRESAAPDELQDVPDSHESPSVELARFEGHARLLEALAELEVEDQELLTLRFFERKTWPEVARTLGVAEATARRHMPQALARLTQRLRG